MKPKTVTSKDELQDGYTYTLSAQVGKGLDSLFKPSLTPKEMLELGIMGGAYFSTSALQEFPKAWYTKTSLSKDGKQHKELNFFDIYASQSRKEWQRKGWIDKEDPRGWIQWYFRYYLGRRLPDIDARQIKRWDAFRRHATQVHRNCRPKDLACRPRQRQSLLHWAYDSRLM